MTGKSTLIHPPPVVTVPNSSVAAYLVTKCALAGHFNVTDTADKLSNLSHPVVVIVPDSTILESLGDNIEFFLSGYHQNSGLSSGAPTACFRFSGWEVLPFDVISPAQEISAQRVHALLSLRRGVPGVYLASADALMQRLPDPAYFLASVIELGVGDPISRDDLISILDYAGFVRTTLVEECGQMSVRGAVVDLFPATTTFPVRVELFGDRIETLRLFKPEDQRSLSSLNSLTVYPVSEILSSSVVSRNSRLNCNSALINQFSLEQLQDRLLQRASELHVPSRHVSAVIEAVSSGSRLAGLEHQLPLILPEMKTFWDYLPEQAQIVIYDRAGVESAAGSFADLVHEQSQRAVDEGRLVPTIADSFLALEELGTKFTTASLDLNASGLQVDVEDETNRGDVVTHKPHSQFRSNDQLLAQLTRSRNEELPLKPLAEEIRHRLARGLHVGFVISHPSRANRIKGMLASYEITCHENATGFIPWRLGLENRVPAENEVSLLIGVCHRGFTSFRDNFSLIGESEVFPGAISKRVGTSHARVKKLLGSVSQLSENDYVVHVDHGVGIYRGLRQIDVGGSISDFLHLEYFGGDKLFVPVDNIGKVQKYIGAEGQQPALSKLGTKTWERTKEKVKEQVATLAGQLVSLYASRQVAAGHSFGPIDSDDQDFASTFSHVETPDQQLAIDEVLRDMAGDKPMDRLVCGDVGYGKTEVAIRAAFKAVSVGKQVAVLVPTTILADQHLATFNNRFAGYPFVVKAVSRFYSPAENKKTLDDVASGKVDVVIGTHRLLQRDVYFKDLGLVVIDEEHRFGVAHKERLKRYRQEVDVLTLTATPIPRTLHMSLLGIRDLSVIETAPTDRHVIRTYISPYRDTVVREAILREKGRGGQIFYIHNRVHNIGAIAAELAELVPEVRIEFAHGQMRDDELESVMHRFIQGEIDVLVSTTIVESGLDIPNANTIIIRDAHLFGLAELYQLRGRVGRSSRRAHAYLFIGDERKLSGEAKKRLAVLQSLDDLGQGFRLALQDMEIRGAGNLLGKDQSGEVNLVGFELYSKILEEAVTDVKRSSGGKGNYVPKHLVVDPEVNIGFPSHIPPDFIPDVAERLILYQRLVDLSSREEGVLLAEEIEDRFGHLPSEVETLVDVMIYRAVLKQAAVVSAAVRGRMLSLAFHRQAPISPERVIALVQGSQGRVTVSPDMVVRARLEDDDVTTPESLYHFTERLLRGLGIDLEV